MGSKRNHLAHAKRLRDRAQECRALSKISADEAIVSSYLLLADNYEQLAQEEEDLAFAYKDA